MLNNISNEDLILNNSISRQAKLVEIDNKSASQNPYVKSSELADVIDISEQAKKLYEREQEIEKYKSLVLESLDSPDDPEHMTSILDSIKSSEYISNEELAAKMLNGDLQLNNSELLKILLSHPEIAE